MEWNCVKQDWVSQRKKKLMLSFWKPKWMALYNSPQPQLAIYSDRSKAVPPYQPKILVPLSDCTVTNVSEPVSGEKVAGATFMLHIHSKEKNYIFNASSKEERKFWISAINKVNNFKKDEEEAAKKKVIPSDPSMEFNFLGQRILDNEDVRFLFKKVENRENNGGNSNSLDDFISMKVRQASMGRVRLLSNPEGASLQNQFLSLIDSFDASDLKKQIKLANLLGQFHETICIHAEKFIEAFQVTDSNMGSYSSISNVYDVGDVKLYYLCDYSEANQEEINERKADINHELKAIQAIRQVNSNLSCSLVGLVTYKGFKMVGELKLPFSEQTNILNINNGKINIDALLFLENLGHALNLEPRVKPIEDGHELLIGLSPNVECHYWKSKFFITHLNDIFPLEMSRMKDYSHRFRPEFISNYSPALPATNQILDATEENEASELEWVYGSKNLLEITIPEFVKKLDNMEVMSLSSQDFTTFLHNAGINCRHLGLIANFAKLPFVKEKVQIEILARTFKSLFEEKLKSALIHFKGVQAMRVEDEIVGYVVQLFNSFLFFNKKSWDEDIIPRMERKFNYTMSSSDFSSVHKQSLFLACQFHCGVKFRNNLLISTPNNLAFEDFQEFQLKCKKGEGLVDLSAKDETSLQFFVAKLISCRPTSEKLAENEEISQLFYELSSVYLKSGRLSEAVFVHKLAVSFLPEESIRSALLKLQDVQLKLKMGTLDVLELSPIISQTLDSATKDTENYLGDCHPFMIHVYDLTSQIYKDLGELEICLNMLQTAFDYSFKLLGKNHIVTIKYLVKMGQLSQLLDLHQAAIDHFKNALQCLCHSPAIDVLEFQSEIQYQLANSLKQIGDYDSALQFSVQAADAREKQLGPNHTLTVNSLYQVAQISTINIPNLDNFLTADLAETLKIGLNAYEKIYRHLKKHSSNNEAIRQELFAVMKAVIIYSVQLLPPHQRSIIASLRKINKTFTSNFLREIIVNLVTLGPTAFIESLLAKMDRDSSCEDSLIAVLQIAEMSNVITV